MDVRTSYARAGGFNVAYQVVGEGELDLVGIPIWVSHLEVAWEHPALAGFYRRLASFSRLIVFDKRGTGLSDRLPHDSVPTLEERVEDIQAVMNAVGSERAALFGMHDGGTMAALFAATHPERTAALVTFGMFAKRVVGDDFELGWSPERRRLWLDEIERDWGRPVGIEHVAPSAADDAGFRSWWARYLRFGASPGAAVALTEWNSAVDVRAVLPAVRVPTLVLHRVGDRRVSIEEARWIAATIPDARLVELPGEDHLPWVGDADAVLDEVEEFLTGVRRGGEPDRVLATLLFTDLVASTERAAELGDRAWRDLLEAHDGLVRAELARWGGREVDTTGDGFLALFDGPARAIRCGLALAQRVRALDLDLRVGVHTGEVERAAGTLRGLAVHIGARVASLAGPGEVLVSQTVKDLVVGSRIDLVDRGEHELKGVPGRWRLYSAAR